ncbi:MAG: hypothetical protein M9887_07180 [Chitinophagales bacterium]|nr:hypothetical protein [Chitinophagales bacterium]
MWRGLLSQEGKDHKDIFILKLYAETDSTLFGTSKIVSKTGEYSEFYIEGTFDSTHVNFQDMQLIKNDGNAYLYKDCIKDFFSNVSFDGKKWVMTGTWNRHPNDSIPPSSTCTKGKYYLTKVLTYTDKVQEDKEKIRYFQGRLIEIQNSFEVESDTLILSIIDDNQIDNDTVTIFFDKKLIVKKLGLSYECYDFEIVLDDDHEHLLVIYANNVGEIPPNTAAISFIDNGKKRELSIRSDMSKSSGIIFKKKKKSK